MAAKKKVRLHWRDITAGVNAIRDACLGYYVPVGIVAVARGGLIPATMLAHALKIRKLVSLSLMSYADDSLTGGELTSYGVLPEEVMACNGRGWLVVDDIIDSGNSMRYMKRLLPEAKTAALYYCRQEHVPTFWYRNMPKDCWLVFPWERRQ